MVSSALEQRILDFVRDAAADDFGELALAVFALQFEGLPGYRKHCSALGVAPATISDWREIPAVETGAPFEFESRNDSLPPGFREALLRAALPDLFGEAPLWLLMDGGSAAGAASPPVIDTLAGQAPQGSFLSRGPRLDAKRLRSWLGARQRDRRPVVLIAPPSGYSSLAQVLERRSLKFRLPPGSAAFGIMGIGPDTGDAADVTDVGGWSAPLAEIVGLSPETCRRVICGPASSTPLLEVAEGTSGRFPLPHWVQATALDTAQLAILDLASIEAPAHRIERVVARVDSENSDQNRYSGDGQVLVLG